MQPTAEEGSSLHAFGTRLNGIHYIERSGVYAVIENDHKQIAVIETSAGYFLPGGGIDPGETEINALKREIMEEIGHQVSVVTEIGEAVEYIKGRMDGTYFRIHGTFYKARIETKIGEGMEKDHRLIWLSPEEACKVLVRQGQVWAIQNTAKA
jgi:8-oxo-dGTP diphosphatase